MSTAAKDGSGRLILVRSTTTSSAPSSAKSPGGDDDASDGIFKTAGSNVARALSKSRRVCADLFLPIGYPASVADGYLEYQFYDSLQGLCSYLRGVVSISAVLSATGVGDAEATAMSAAMTWAVRDGLGMIGGLLFSYVASPHFDAHVKEFRLLADVLNDAGLALDMALPLVLDWVATSSAFSGSWHSALAPYLPSPYLVMTSASTLCKVACGMAAGATKGMSCFLSVFCHVHVTHHRSTALSPTPGNITDHFAIVGNRADCQSKESTQETLVSLVGMCCGVWLANILHRLEKDVKGDGVCSDGGSESATSECTINAAEKTLVDVQLVSWTIFIVLTLIHVWANYIGMQMLRLRTLNRERTKVALQLLVRDCGQWVLENMATSDEKHFESVDPRCPNTKSTKASSSKNLVIEKASSNLLPPESVSESLWKSMQGMVRPGKIQLGTRLKDLVRSPSTSKYCSTERCENYMIFVDCRGIDMSNRSSSCSIKVVLRVDADDRDELKAFLHAHIVDWCMEKGEWIKNGSYVSELLSRSYVITKSLFLANSPGGMVNLYDALSAKGWDMTRLYLGFGCWRCQWEDDKKLQ
ncbi:hypothetical protein ACHAWF_016410 [Thalassiosira exigua]